MNIRRTLIFIALLIAGESIFLLPFILVRIFRPTILAVFEINNFQLGSAFSVYGILAMISYFFGGPIADKIHPKKLITVSLLATSLGGVILSLNPTVIVLTCLYAFWGITTIFLFWAAFIKAIRIYGGKNSQGKAFGIIDAGRGLLAAILASTGVLLFDFILPSSASQASISELSTALNTVILLFALFTAFSSSLIWLIMPNEKEESKTHSTFLSFHEIKGLFYNKSIWVNSIIVLCSYVAYKCTDDFSLYASEVMNYNDVEAAHVGTIAFWLRPVAALLAGFLGDKITHSKAIAFCFGIIILGSTIIASDLIPMNMTEFIIITIATTSLGIYGLRGLYFALLEENKIPIITTGSAIGIISLIGYTPDVFMGPLMGYVLDNSPGKAGHQQLFAIMALFALLGLITSRLLHNETKPRILNDSSH